MVDLYEYDMATEQECLDDLYQIFEEFKWDESRSDDLDTLRRRGIRIQQIAERLKELRDLDD